MISAWQEENVVTKLKGVKFEKIHGYYGNHVTAVTKIIIQMSHDDKLLKSPLLILDDKCTIFHLH